MKTFVGIDLGSTTTKAVLVDETGEILGKGITNSRSNYHLAADIARNEAFIGARFTLIKRHATDVVNAEGAKKLTTSLLRHFRMEQSLSQVQSLREIAMQAVEAPRLAKKAVALKRALMQLFEEMEHGLRKPSLLAGKKKSDFFRDQAASDFAKLAETHADGETSFDDLMGIFDKAIIQVENQSLDLSYEGNVSSALEACLAKEPHDAAARYRALVDKCSEEKLEVCGSIGTGYGRQRLPFPKDDIRSEILCHGLGAHVMFPGTATVLDIGGQDTKAIQVDDHGIVTSFQMNDRCAAGCGRYLGYIADELSLGIHELGPMAMQSTRRVKINSTCTVFAGAELRDRLTMGQRREDILAGLHRAIILRAMSLLARSGGIDDEFTFTGGVANNQAAVNALNQLVAENYGERTINISPSSIYTGALGAALFSLRSAVVQ
jgi:benzoyl-CoA reductase subunit A